MVDSAGPQSGANEAATLRAAARMAAVKPIWRSTGRAQALLGLGPRELLHAGPPVLSPGTLSQTLLNAACAALLFEGEADNPEQARNLVLSGDVRLRPAQDWGVTTPLAAVVSSSMWLHQVVDAEDPSVVAYAPLNEGAGPAQRFGCLSPAVVERLQFVHGVLGPALAAKMIHAVDLLEIAVEGLAQGDELHARVGVGSALIAERLSRYGFVGAAGDFLRGNNQSFLNLWMAACRCMMTAASKQAEGQLLVAAGGNGTDFGVQLSCAPGQWLSAPASTPVGPLFSQDFVSRPRLPAIGDSAVIDAVGLGALALDAAPEHAAILDPEIVGAMKQVAEEALSIRHPVLNRRVALNAARVSTGSLPGVCLAVLDAAGEAGLIGRGLALHPSPLYPIAV